MYEDDRVRQEKILEVVKELVESNEGLSNFEDREDNVFMFKQLVSIAHLLNLWYDCSFKNWRDYLENEAQGDHAAREKYLISWLAEREDEGDNRYLDLFNDIYNETALVEPKEEGELGTIMWRDELEDESYPELSMWMRDNLPSWD